MILPMKKYILTLACLVALGAQAQNVYEIEQVGGLDLNGTARFVGMGGAMNALGADLSTMGGNPAAIGLYRRSDVSLSFSSQTQKDAVAYGGQGKTRASFDQAGLVYALKTGNDKLRYFNFGFNYQKSRNLKQFIGTPYLSLNGMSLTHQLAQHLYFSNPTLADYYNYNSVISNGAEDAGLIGSDVDANGNYTGDVLALHGDRYGFDRANWGYVGEYDINMAANIKDRVYVGMTIGVYQVKAQSKKYYEEYFQEKALVPGSPEMSYDINEVSDLRGSGFDMKFGAVVRPIEENPFRFGLAFHTPRILTLSQSKALEFRTSQYVPFDPNPDAAQTLRTGTYDYNIRTPWRLQVSAATTVSNWLALDAEYEVAMYNKTGIKYPTRYNYYDGSSSITNSMKDEFVASEVGYCLRPQHTVRIGAEARFANNWYARLGYNFVSAPFKKDAFLNYSQPLDGDIATNNNGDVTWVEPSFRSSYNLTSTDYTNLGATNRLSFGLGWHTKHFYIDAAYMLQSQSAKTYAFSEVDYDISQPNEFGTYDLASGNLLPAYSTQLVRHSALFTLGVKF